MKKAYPVVLSRGVTHIIAYVPDFNINSQGCDLAEAMEMARDAIGLMGIDMEDDGLPLPDASALSGVKASSNEIVTLVDVDFAEYRRKHDSRAVKKNCTLPSWLAYEAEQAGINFSAVLQAALKAKLHIHDR